MTVDMLATTRAPLSAEDLLQEVAAGDHASFSSLYALTSSRVYGLVRRVLLNVEQSEEVTQEIFLEVWLLASRYNRERGTATSWILTIANRRAIDRVRSSQASRNRDLKVGIRDRPVPSDEVADNVEIKLEHERAKRALHCLSPVQVKLLSLSYWEGFTVTEISERLNLSKPMVRRTLRHSLLELRAEMLSSSSEAS